MIHNKRLAVILTMVVVISVGVLYVIGKKRIGADTAVTTYQPPQNYFEVSGRVTDKNGQPLPNITIYAGTRRSTTNNQGNYLLSFLADDFTNINSIDVFFASSSAIIYAEAKSHEPTSIVRPTIWQPSSTAARFDVTTASSLVAAELQQKRDFVIEPVQ